MHSRSKYSEKKYYFFLEVIYVNLQKNCDWKSQVMKKIINILLVLALALVLCACGAQHYEATEPQAHSSENILTPADLVRSTDSAVTTGSSDIFVNTVYPNRETISVDVRLLVTNEDGTNEVIDLEAQAVKWTHNYAEPLLNVVNGIPRGNIKEIWIRTDEFPLSYVNCCSRPINRDDLIWRFSATSHASHATTDWHWIPCVRNHFNEIEKKYTYELIPIGARNYYFAITFYFTI